MFTNTAVSIRSTCVRKSHFFPKNTLLCKIKEYLSLYCVVYQEQNIKGCCLMIRSFDLHTCHDEGEGGGGRDFDDDDNNNNKNNNPLHHHTFHETNPCFHIPNAITHGGG